MKKKLEADLLSIAHRILQMKNKSDQDQVFAEVQKLYEKLTVMRFVEEHFSEIKPTAGSADIEAEMEKAFEEAEAHDTPVKTETDTAEKPGKEAEAEAKPETEQPNEVRPEEDKGEKQEETPEAKEEIPMAKEEAAEPWEEAPEVKEEAAQETEKAEEDIQETKEEAPEAKEEAAKETEEDTEAPAAKEDTPVAKEETHEETQAAAVEQQTEAPAETDKEERKPTQISFDDLMQHHYEEPVFERADAAKKEVVIPVPETVPQPEAVEEAAVALGGDEDIKVVETPKAIQPQEEKRPSSLHEQIGKTITIGLNDRIGFEKNLFAGSAEDMNRVLSQLNTFNSLQEARDFIEDMVKPDYNNWTGKEDYEQRFLDIVERKFS